MSAQPTSSASLLDHASFFAGSGVMALPNPGDRVTVLCSKEVARTPEATARPVRRNAVVLEIMRSDSCSRTCAIVFDPADVGAEASSFSGNAPEQPTNFTFELGRAGQEWWPRKASGEGMVSDPVPENGRTGKVERPTRRDATNFNRVLASLNSHPRHHKAAESSPDAVFHPRRVFTAPPIAGFSLCAPASLPAKTTQEPSQRCIFRTRT